VIDGFVSLLRLLEFVPTAAREARRQSGGRASQIKLRQHYLKATGANQRRSWRVVRRAELSPQSASSTTRDSARASTSTRAPGSKLLLSQAVKTMSSPPSSRVIQTLPARQETLPPSAKYVRFVHPFESSWMPSSALGRSWAFAFVLTHKCASNSSHPPYILTLRHGGAWRPVVAGKSRFIGLGNEVIAAAVAKRAH
jgi:hypothetical protein